MILLVFVRPHWTFRADGRQRPPPCPLNALDDIPPYVRQTRPWDPWLNVCSPAASSPACPMGAARTIRYGVHLVGSFTKTCNGHFRLGQLQLRPFQDPVDIDARDFSLDAYACMPLTRHYSSTVGFRAGKAWDVKAAGQWVGAGVAACGRTGARSCVVGSRMASGSPNRCEPRFL